MPHHTPHTQTPISLKQLYEEKDKLERKQFRIHFMRFIGITERKLFYDRLSGTKKLEHREAVFIAKWFSTDGRIIEPQNLLLPNAVSPEDQKLINSIPRVREGEKAEVLDTEEVTSKYKTVPTMKVA